MKRVRFAEDQIMAVLRGHETGARQPIGECGKLAARLPEIEVSGIAARHSRGTSSTRLRIRKCRPQAS